MGILDIFLQALSTSSLVGALVVLVLVYIVSSSSFGSQDEGKGPPGPKPLPLLGNLLQLDLKRPYHTLLEVRQCRTRSFLLEESVSDSHKALVLFAVFCVLWKQNIMTLCCSLAFQEIWISVYHLFGTPKSGGPGRIQDSKGGTSQSSWRVWR